MGHMKNQAISKQEEIDNIVSWYRYHEEHLPLKDFATLLSSDTLMDLSLRDWAEGRPWVPSPRKATDHVALRNRDHIRAERYTRRRFDWVPWVGWPLVAISLAVSTYILIMEVF